MNKHFLLVTFALVLAFGLEAQIDYSHALLTSNSGFCHLRLLKETHYEVKDSMGMPVKGAIKNVTYYWFDELGARTKEVKIDYLNGEPHCKETRIARDIYTDTILYECPNSPSHTIVITGDPLVEFPYSYIENRECGNRHVNIYKYSKRKIKKEVYIYFYKNIDSVTLYKKYIYPRNISICWEKYYKSLGCSKSDYTLYEGKPHKGRWRRQDDKCLLDIWDNEVGRYDENLKCMRRYTYVYHPQYQSFWISKTSAFDDYVYDICEREILETSH